MPQHTTIAPLTRRQVREVDRLAIEELGIPGIVLMENSARHASEVLLAALDRGLQREPGRVPAGRMPTPAASQRHTGQARVTVLCGGGNNGGDGYAIARHLHNHGVAVTVYALNAPAELTGDAATNHRICERMGLPIEPVLDEHAVDAVAGLWGEADAVVDALLGTGFTGQVREPVATAIRRLNALDGPWVLAVDVPSGLDCDTGEPAEALGTPAGPATGPARGSERDAESRPAAGGRPRTAGRSGAADAPQTADLAGAVERPGAADLPGAADVPGAGTTVRADVTVTFVARKVGFARASAAPWLGEVAVADIGVPPELIERVRCGT